MTEKSLARGRSCNRVGVEREADAVRLRLLRIWDDLDLLSVASRQAESDSAVAR